MSSLYWYTVPRLIQRWEGLRRSYIASKSDKPAVRKRIGFFIAHRVLGSTGSYGPMGFRIAANRAVTHDAWWIYQHYFDGTAESDAAFARFIARAHDYNPNRRSTQYRKTIFHGLREASVAGRDDLASIFDSLATPEEAAVLRDYQAGGRQDEVLDRFDRLVEETILELNAGVSAGSRIVAAVLLGSFANHAAAPRSDLDLQLVSEDGRGSGNRAFIARLKERWKEEGFPEHPVSGFEYGLRLSRGLLDLVHREPYRLITPYQPVAEALSRTQEEEESLDLPRRRTIAGLMFQAFYSSVLFGVLWGYEAAQWMRGRRRSGPFRPLDD